MKTVLCSNYDCVYCDKQYRCQRDVISVGDDYRYGCEDYVSYLDTEEYKAKFYKAIKTKNGKKARAVDYGKKIEYNGRAFYTRDKVADDESYSITDERTGFLIGNMAWLKDNWEKFLASEKEYPDIKTYPLAVRNCNEYVLVDKGGAE